MPAEIQVLINIHKDQTALIYTLWSVFQGLSFVLIGYVFSQDYVRKSPLILSCFSASILLFSIGNHSAIMRAQLIVEAATRQLHSLAKNPAAAAMQDVLLTFQAPPTQQLAWAHIMFVVFVAAGIWVPFVASRFSAQLGDSTR